MKRSQGLSFLLASRSVTASYQHCTHQLRSRSRPTLQRTSRHTALTPKQLTDEWTSISISSYLAYILQIIKDFKLSIYVISLAELSRKHTAYNSSWGILPSTAVDAAGDHNESCREGMPFLNYEVVSGLSVSVLVVLIAPTYFQ